MSKQRPSGEGLLPAGITAKDGSIFLTLNHNGTQVNLDVEGLKNKWRWCAILPAAGNYMELSGYTKSYEAAYRAAMKAALEIVSKVQP